MEGIILVGKGFMSVANLKNMLRDCGAGVLYDRTSSIIVRHKLKEYEVSYMEKWSGIEVTAVEEVLGKTKPQKGTS